MLDPDGGHNLSHLLYLQTDSEDRQSVRGAQLLLAGTTLQQYCAAGEEEDDESEDGVDVIDVRHLKIIAVVFVYDLFPFNNRRPSLGSRD